MILLKVCSAASLLGEGFMNQVTSTNKASLSLLSLTMKVAKAVLYSCVDYTQHHSMNSNVLNPGHISSISYSLQLLLNIQVFCNIISFPFEELPSPFIVVQFSADNISAGWG